MFRPQIQKTWVVLVVSMFSIMMIYFALGNITYHKTVGFNNKKEAIQIMEEALSVLKKKVKIERIHFFGKVEFSLAVNFTS